MFACRFFAATLAAALTQFGSTASRASEASSGHVAASVAAEHVPTAVQTQVFRSYQERVEARLRAAERKLADARPAAFAGVCIANITIDGVGEVLKTEFSDCSSPAAAARIEEVVRSAQPFERFTPTMKKYVDRIEFAWHVKFSDKPSPRP